MVVVVHNAVRPESIERSVVVSFVVQNHYGHTSTTMFPCNEPMVDLVVSLRVERYECHPHRRCHYHVLFRDETPDEFLSIPMFLDRAGCIL